MDSYFLYTLSGDDQLAATDECYNGNKPLAALAAGGGADLAWGDHFDAGDFV
jgi:hypothetical protein